MTEKNKKMKKYKVSFKVEKWYQGIEIETDHPYDSDEFGDTIYDIIGDDYRVGNMDSDLSDEIYSVEKIEEIK